MSGGASAATVAAYGALAVAAVGTTVSAIQQHESSRRQKNANRKAEQQAKETKEMSAQENRRANGNEADISSILEQNSNAGLSGGSTLLNGAQGVDKSKMNLGGGSTLG